MNILAGEEAFTVSREDESYQEAKPGHCSFLVLIPTPSVSLSSKALLELVHLAMYIW